jgi:hypothetical protein
MMLANALHEPSRRRLAELVATDCEDTRVAAVRRDIRRLAPERDHVDLRVVEQPVREPLDGRVDGGPSRASVPA